MEPIYSSALLSAPFNEQLAAAMVAYVRDCLQVNEAASSWWQLLPKFHPLCSGDAPCTSLLQASDIPATAQCTRHLHARVLHYPDAQLMERAPWCLYW